MRDSPQDDRSGSARPLSPRVMTVTQACSSPLPAPWQPLPSQGHTPRAQLRQRCQEEHFIYLTVTINASCLFLLTYTEKAFILLYRCELCLLHK